MQSRNELRQILLAVAVIYISDAQARGQTVTINFDNLPTETDVTNQYPQVRFSSAQNFVNRTAANYPIGSSPNYICTAEVGGQGSSYWSKGTVSF